MFDVGFSEMLVIAVVALLVLGPERLPRAARMAGLWVRRARAQWYSVKAELESELAAEDLKQQLRTPVDDLHRELRAPLDEVRNAVDAVGHAPAEVMTPPPRPPDPPADPT